MDYAIHIRGTPEGEFSFLTKVGSRDEALRVCLVCLKKQVNAIRFYNDGMLRAEINLHDRTHNIYPDIC